MNAIRQYKAGTAQAEKVRVFEKLRDGIWVYYGLFELIDGWQETNASRQVFKFMLRLIAEPLSQVEPAVLDVENDRVVPSSVKLEVWKRDKGRCVTCGCSDNLHFDHIIPYSQAGSSKDSKELQTLRSTTSRNTTVLSKFLREGHCRPHASSIACEIMFASALLQIGKYCVGNAPWRPQVAGCCWGRSRVRGRL